ncbi:MAG TPA: single-stranded-DNA-specific exonuclease RecJ [Gemmatimonadaceae bacterium]|nr:single-stranded-DNA-specific exonuclease RecJ [Gemmatimonadaceae bacterium]
MPTPIDPAAIAALAAELHLPPIVCELLCRRGYLDADPAKRYLRPRLDQLHDPEQLLGLPVAVERLAQAIANGEVILVHGDYDVDGICSTTILVRTIRAHGGRVVPFIPRRLEDGYDLTMAGVRAAIAENAKVIVTCDCGTSAVDPIAAACAAGIDVIVSDHHLPGGPLPDCLAVINPKQQGCQYPDKDLAAAGIAFKIALALTKRLGGDQNVVLSMLDLVAMATIADVAPLRGENRIFARYGLRLMQNSPTLGLRALIRAAGLAGKPLTAGRVGFTLAPRLNAAGRLGHALRGVQLLTTEDEHEANVIARELEELNQQRQAVDRATLADARKKLEQTDLDARWGLVLAQEGWHPGVIGIVASRIVEETWRPVVMISLEGNEGKGSGRSIPAFDLHAGLSECRDLFVRFGGHRTAAGLTIDRSRLEEFEQRFDAVAHERLSMDDLVPEVKVDVVVPLSALNGDLETLLRHFEPHGVGNATPVFAITGAKLATAPRIVGQGHLKLWLSHEDARIDAIGWGMGSLIPELENSALLDVAFRLERDEWNGQPRLQAKLADIRPHL